MTGYVRKCEDNRTISLKISNKQLLKERLAIVKKVQSSMEKS